MPRLTAGRAIFGLLLLFVLMQVIIPAKTNPASDPAMSLVAVRPDAADAVAVMNRACRDCHSNDTTWPWYSNVAPVSWLVAHDVNEGRGEFNISEFGSYPLKKQQNKLKEACDQVTQGEMPMWIYTLQHPGAKLQPGDVEKICSVAPPATVAVAQAP